MSLISEILDHNRSFIARREYEAFLTDQFPNKRLVVLSCMDTRLVELLPRAMGFRNGDVKMVKNAGAIVSHLTTGYALSGLGVLVPMTVLTVTSWALRPASRRMPSLAAWR